MATRKIKTTARRREVRRTIERPNRQWLRWFNRHEVYLTVLHVVLFTTLSSLMVISGRGRLPNEEGQPVTEPVISRVRFESIDKEATAANVEKEPAYYKPNTIFFDTIRDRLMDLVGLAADKNIQSIQNIPEEQVKSLQLTDLALEKLRDFVDQDTPSKSWLDLVDQFISDLSGLAILSESDIARERENKALAIMILHPKDSAREQRDYLIFSQKDAEKDSFLKSRIDGINQFPKALRAVVLAVVINKIEPTYVWDEKETQHQRDKAKTRPDIIVKQTFEPNDVLVQVGVEQQRTITDLDIRLIKAERLAYQQQLNPVNRAAIVIGNVAVVLILASSLWMYFATYYERIVANAMRGLAIMTLLLLAQGLGLALSSFGSEFVYFSCILPTLAVSIVLAIAYDQRFALAVGAIHSLLVTFGLDLPLGFLLVLLVGVAVAVKQLYEVRSRSKLVLAGLWTGMAMSISVVLIGFMDRPLHVPGEHMRIGLDAVWVLAAAFVAGLLVHGILPGIERLFSITTSMTLKELNDISHPLLRKLADQAPGTHLHSLTIGDMGETAADAIGADGLMCRVGAMYHDIGKINKPAYFVENQGGGPNKHNKLSPAMSLLIIVGHVKDGIEMAREYHLPPAIRHFIESHHGTTLVEYFYHAAKKQQQSDTAAKPEPSEFEFRYPGPKPRTKEAAIIMLCDSIESAARTMTAATEPTPARLEQLVHQIANKRLMDGQFDECNLTLQELSKIEQSITKTLCAIYHRRIAYPSDQDESETQVEGAESA